MKKKKLKNIAGVTLIEILIGVVMSTLMMAAIFTTYQVVSNSYSQVTDRAKISRSGRDIVSMLMRDIRLAGFKYYLGVNGDGISVTDDLSFYGGTTEHVQDSHDPLIIVQNKLGYTTKKEDDEGMTPNNPDKDLCCDRIHIVYGDYDEDDPDQKYKRYRITYYAEPRGEECEVVKAENEGEEDKKDCSEADRYYGVYKTKESWEETDENPGSWIVTGCAECYTGEFIRDHLVDMEFIPFTIEGKAIIPPPHPNKDSRIDLYNIRSVDVRLTFRSKQEFFRYRAKKGTPRLVKGIADRTREFFDRFLRDSVVVTVHTRNIGI